MALITAGLGSMATLLGPGFGNQTVNVRFFDAECLHPLRAIAQEVRPRTLFDIPLHCIGEHFINAAMLATRSGFPPATAQEVRCCLRRPWLFLFYRFRRFLCSGSAGTSFFPFSRAVLRARWSEDTIPKRTIVPDPALSPLVRRL